MWPNPQEDADLVRFTEETLNGKFPLNILETSGQIYVFLQLFTKISVNMHTLDNFTKIDSITVS